MSKGASFFIGVVTGFLLTVGIALIIAKLQTSSSGSDGLSMFPERGQAMTESSFKIFQTLDDQHALATGVSDEKHGWYRGVTVMLLGSDGSHFYDDQIVKRAPGKKFYHVGTYKYQTKSEDFKTVPVVSLLDTE